MRRGFTKGLRYTIDLTKIADRENPRTVEAPIDYGYSYTEPIIIDWGDGTVEEKTSGAWLSHEYATVGVYTVTIRSATGHLPSIRFCKDTTNGSSESTPTYNVTLAVTSIDHFAGQNGGNGISRRACCCYTANLGYVDPRFIGGMNYTYLNLAFFHSGTNITLDSVCLDFQTSAVSYTSLFEDANNIQGHLREGFLPNTLTPSLSLSNMFYGCDKITGALPDILSRVSAYNAYGMFNGCSGLTGTIPDGFLDKNTNSSFYAFFRNCSVLTPPPCVFWKADGTLDTDKFPNLTTASSAYSGCSAEMRAQVPTTYGGTMTVS